MKKHTKLYQLRKTIEELEAYLLTRTQDLALPPTHCQHEKLRVQLDEQSLRLEQVRNDLEHLLTTMKETAQ